ncbi:hypothetical protein A9Q81_08105 [Gammaproteobacteria bacterium 42_54_T18]|nr:hypothetical protein A9Q81_08105 [Gammaproteobacteria bacterium 42_54_T18]
MVTIETTINGNALRQAGRNIAAPFTLQLSSGDQTHQLPCSELLRLLPHKRITCFAQWNEQPVVVKCFIDPIKWKRHTKRELQGYQSLKKAGITTPDMLEYGFDEQQKLGFIIFQRLSPSQSLLNKLDSAKGSEEKQSLIQRACQLIALMHNKGVAQLDIHLDNFIEYKDNLYVVDCGDITISPHPPLDRGNALNNLALFFAQLPLAFNEKVGFALDTYQSISIGKSFDSNALLEHIQNLRSQRLANYQKKLLRDCTEIAFTQDLNHLFACRREHLKAGLLEWSQHPNAAFEKEPLLKNGSQTIVRDKIDNNDAFIKRYNIRGVGHQTRRALRSTRAHTSWIAAHSLISLGINTPKPIAMLEQRIGPVRRHSYYISEFIAGTTLRDFFDTDTIDLSTDPIRQQLVSKLIDIFALFKLAKISHGDTKDTNFMVVNNDIFVIDLDAVRFHQSNRSFKRAFNKDIQRFLRNWENQPKIKALFEKELTPLL